MRTENDNTGEIFRANGEQAIITNYTTNYNTKIEFKYIDNDDVDDFDNFVEKSSKEYLEFKEEFALAYSLTVHKSQGSQYDTVIIFIDPNQRIWNKKALYTAISRCKQRCIIISTYNDFISAQKNNNEDANLSLFMEEFNEYDVTIK
jgi:ATP-dependent exoDNAse (exonuclease V) alpha subunit